jgi:hypothetical protein
MALEWMKRRIRPGGSTTSRTFDLYVSSSPSSQNAVDAIAGWNTSFPPQYGLKAGPLAAYSDPRILWAIKCFGSLEGRNVLELGPLEGGHTAMLEAAGARVAAIEEDQVAFLRCLIAREILGLTQCKFWLGDFMMALENWEQRYDLIVACGVLHHLTEPLRLIELAAKRADAIYIWARVVTDEALASRSWRRIIFAQPAEHRLFHGIDVRAYRRRHAAHDQEDVAFCGYMYDEHHWLHRDDLLEALKVVGFHDIRTSHDEPHGRSGPALSVFARR